MRLSLALTFLSLLLAGCATSPEPVTTAKTIPAPPSVLPDAEAGENRTIPVEVPILWDGKVVPYVGACIRLGEGVCPGVPLGHWENQVHRLPIGNYTHATLTLTWAATTPATNELRFAVFNVTKKDDGSESWVPISPWASGASPLTLDSPLSPLAPNQESLVLVVPVNLVLTPLVLRASTEQPFAVEGMLTKHEPSLEV